MNRNNLYLLLFIFIVFFCFVSVDVTIIAKNQTTATKKQNATTKKQATATKKQDTTTKKQGTATKKQTTATKKQDTATKKQDTTTKKQDTATKKQDTATKKQDTATKKQDTATKKQDTATKKQNTTTKKQEPLKLSGKETDLEAYVKRIKQLDPYAVITGWFSDWRDVSMYRRNAGYHYGYDIGLLRGFRVPAGWAGTVTAIIPWSDYEWGIMVTMKNGYSVTYGHLTPLVKVGTEIEPGMVVGEVAVNHVDIKVRDPEGNFVDIGNTRGLLAISPDVRFYPSVSNSYYYPIEIDYTKIVEAKKGELLRLHESIAILQEYYDAENDILKMVKSDTERCKSIYDRGLISRTDLENQLNEEESQNSKVKDLKNRLSEQQKKAENLKKFILKHGGKEPQYIKKEKKIKDEDRERLEKAKEEAEKYQRLFEEGAVSKKLAESKEREYKRLKLEIMLKTEE